MLYLVNPQRKRTKPKGKRMATKRKAKRSRKQIAAARRNIKKAQAARRKKAGTRKRSTKRRASTARRKTSTRRKPVARKRSTRRKSTRRRRSPAKRRRSKSISFRRIKGSVYKRNPRFSVRNMGKLLRQGVTDAAGVVVGKAATRMVANFIPLDKSNPVMNFAVQAVSAIGVSIVAGNVVSPNMAKMILAGGFAAPVESFLSGIPVIGPALGDVDPFLPYGDVDPFLPYGSYPEWDQMGAYPEEVVVA